MKATPNRFLRRCTAILTTIAIAHVSEAQSPPSQPGTGADKTGGNEVDSSPRSRASTYWPDFQSKEGRQWTVRWDTQTGCARLLRGGPSSPLVGTVPEAARAFVEQHAALFGYGGPDAELRLISETDTPIGRRVTFQQMHRRLPVYHAFIDLTVNEARRIVYVASTLAPGLELNITPTVTAAAAQQPIERAVGPNATVVLRMPPQLVVYPRPPTLAYQVYCNIDPGAVPWEYLLDANTGQILRATRLVLDQKQNSSSTNTRDNGATRNQPDSGTPVAGGTGPSPPDDPHVAEESPTPPRGGDSDVVPQPTEAPLLAPARNDSLFGPEPEADRTGDMVGPPTPPIGSASGAFPSEHPTDAREARALAFPNLLSTAQPNTDQCGPIWRADRPLSAYRVTDEIVPRRDAYSKHFRKGDGTTTSFLFLTPVHYLDPDGVWREIRTDVQPNDSLSSPGYAYGVSQNRHQLFFGSLSTDGYAIRFPTGDVTIGARGELRIETGSGDLLLATPRQPVDAVPIDHRVIYPNAFAEFGADEEIAVHTNGVKQNIIFNMPVFTNGSLPDSAENLVLREFVGLPTDWSVQPIVPQNMDARGAAIAEALEVVDSNQASVAVFPAPIAREAGPRLGTQYDSEKGAYATRRVDGVSGHYRVLQTAGGVYVDTIVPLAWLRTTDRRFPVIVDPSLTVPAYDWNGASGFSYTSSQCYCGSSSCGDEVRWKGADAENGWMYFNTSSIPDGSDITDVDLHYDVEAWNCPYFQVRALDAYTTLCSDMWSWEHNGQVYYAHTVCSQVTDIDLGASADADLEGNLGADFFGVAFHDTDTSSTYYAVVDSYDFLIEPYLTVTYAPPNRDPDTAYNTQWPSVIYSGQTFTIKTDHTDPDGQADVELCHAGIKINAPGSWDIGMWFDPDNNSFAVNNGGDKITLNSASKSSITNGWRVTWSVTLNWTWEAADESRNLDPLAETDDRAGAWVAKYWDANYDYENDVRITNVTYDTSPPYNASFTVTGDVDYEGVSEPTPPNVFGIRIDPAWSATNYDDSDLSPTGQFSVTVLADTCYPSSFDIDFLAYPTGAGHPSSNGYSVTPDGILATIVDAWWTSEVDEDGDGCFRSATLHWNVDVVGCICTLTVYERIFWKSWWDPFWHEVDAVSPTPQHAITGCRSTNGQEEPLFFTSDCGAFDWRIEVYRVGQTSPDDARDQGDDPHLNDHSEERAADDEPPVTRVFDPNPVNTLNNDTLRDNNDADAAVPAGAYEIVSLTRLDPPSSGQYRLRGSFAFMENIEAPSGDPPTSNTQEFDYTREPDGFEWVMCYYHITKNQEYIQSIGFTNANNRSIHVDAHGLDGQDQSHYRPDPPTWPIGSGYLAFGDGGVDDAEDADIILHEYGHSLQDNQSVGRYFGSGDAGFGDETGAMGEGFGDYWAASCTYAQSLAHGYIASVVGEWDQVPAGLRRVDGTKHYPEDMVNEVHGDGEIWSACLWEMFGAFGKQVADRLVLQSHFLVPSDPTFEDGAEALIAADEALYRGNHSVQIRTIFINRGILGAHSLSNDVPETFSGIPLDFAFQIRSDDWCAVGIAPTTDHDLTVDDNEDFSSPYASSTYAGTTRDFIAVNGQNWGNATHYARVFYGSPSNYVIEAEWDANDQTIGNPHADSMGLGEVIQVYEVALSAGSEYKVTVDISSGSADLALFLFRADRSYGTRDDADWDANALGPGGDERLAFSAPVSGRYGVVVVNENNGSANFTLRIEPCVAPSCCITDAACDDGSFCNGAETCVSSVCQAGVPPNCSDTVACTIDSCDPATNRCLHTPNHAACDDGLFCNGTETCHVTNGCQAGTPPNCSDTVACTIDSCDPTTNRCLHTPNHAACDDGLFCTGVEICDATFGCQPDPNPPIDCCKSDADCDDNNVCNGTRTCNVATHTCTPGDPPVDCTSHTTECATFGCDPLGAVGNCDVVILAPPETPCGSASDTECDNPDFCDGAGLCLNNHEPDGTSCDDGFYCNGMEACQSGTCHAAPDRCPDLCCSEECNECLAASAQQQHAALLYVANKDTNSVSLFDGISGDRLAPYMQNGSGGLNYANGIAISPQTGNILVASVNTATIKEFRATLDACEMSYLGDFASSVVASGIAFGPDGKLYATDWNTNSVVRFDGVSGERDPTFEARGCGLDGPNGLVFTPCGMLLVASEHTGVVVAFDINTGITCSVVATGCGLDVPVGMALLPNGHLLVASSGNDTIVEFDLSRENLGDRCLRNFVAPGACGLDGPGGITIGPNGNVFVASMNTDSVLEFSGVDGTPAVPCQFATGCPMNGPTYLAFGVSCASDSDCDNRNACDGSEQCLAGSCNRGYVECVVDCNENGLSDWGDVRSFVSCLHAQGPDARSLNVACTCADLDRDGFVDLRDVARLQTDLCLNGR